MHRTTSNAVKSLPTKGRARRAAIISSSKESTNYTEIMTMAGDLDERRQMQIAQQSEAITDFVAFMEDRGLMAEYVVWKDARHAT